MKFKHLFTPIQIRGLSMRNRVVLPAMGTKMPTEERYCTQQIIDYHVARAKGGNGMNMVEVCSVHQPSAAKGFLSIAEDRYIPALKKLTEAVHAAGGKIGVQLYQGGLAVGAGDPEVQVLMPDPLPALNIPAVSIETIHEVVDCFGEAARRAVEAGFDCVEFHCAHNYMPHSFLSPAFNHRDDEYGGPFENRARFPLACIRAIRENIPEDMPLFMRIGAHDDYVENGLSIDDVVAFCKLAGEAGVDVLDISRGNFMTSALKYEVPSIDTAPGFNVENAGYIRRHTGMLTMAVGRINTPALAEKSLEDGHADLIGIGRAQLADPEFCNKAREGNDERIVRCIACNQGCFDGFVDPSFPNITCLRNPALGREVEYTLQPAKESNKVLIAGGGMAGLEAAITLKKRGHWPIVAEASDVLGGQFLLAGVAPRKQEMTEAARWMAKEAEHLGIEIRRNTPVTEDLIDQIRPDVVIIAIGAEPIQLNLPGVDQSHVIDSHRLLAGEAEVDGRVVIIGGGLVGLEVAEYLSDKSDNITVVEMLDEVAKDMGRIRKINVMEHLAKDGVKLFTKTSCVEIKEKHVVVKTENGLDEIPADHVIMAVGAASRSSDAIQNACEMRKIPYYTIGDAVQARRVLNATAEAAAIARAI
ncbi:MAG TPA: FAD-dependent oxidoreductase [Tissierellia bacterium]|nr:FAD-dependent oxidoreductase [Tissierellia bacterium]